MVYNRYDKDSTWGSRVPPYHGYEEDDIIRDVDGKILLQWWTVTDHMGNSFRIPGWVPDGRYEGRCTLCAGQRSTKWCNRCAQAVYCSQYCQEKDWREHERECRELSHEEMRSWIWENGDKPGDNTGLNYGYDEGNGDLGYSSGDCSYDRDRDGDECQFCHREATIHEAVEVGNINLS